MPSKKKARGKARARRVAKSRKAWEEDAAVNVASQIQRLQIGTNSSDQDEDEDALLEDAINFAAAEKEELGAAAAAKNDEANNSKNCLHGFVRFPRGHVCGAFIESFVHEFLVGCESASLYDGFDNVYRATKIKYAEVWNDADKMQLVIAFFLCNGAEKILLDGDSDRGYNDAMFVSFLEQVIAVNIQKTEASHDWGKIAEVKCDEHTLVSFFRKRIPCKCLDESYKEVKSITKMGLCHNLSCSLPDRTAERSKMLSCTRCRRANYCSRECQKAAWPLHKQSCGIHTGRLDELQSRQIEEK
eukprot:scaffold594_cov71-Skeletonema_dohrnii-CCMP3373.AAC.5